MATENGVLTRSDELICEKVEQFGIIQILLTYYIFLYK